MGLCVRSPNSYPDPYRKSCFEVIHIFLGRLEASVTVMDA
jgi:hypothetical protein